ncbi:MAG: isochorismatase family protein [Hyphomicrobiales bacterium]|nr:isochorismatase family protein [Hyphomicrobiales bacterium]
MADLGKLDPARTALVLIDLQTGILARDTHPRTSAATLANALALAKATLAKGGAVIAVRVAFAPDGSDRARGLVDEAMAAPPGGYPPDWPTLDASVPALPPTATVTKRHWGAFEGTELDLLLRRRRIETVVVCGIATNFGVEQTVREAWQRDYSVVVAEDACAAVAAGMHEFAMTRILPRIARVRTCAEIEKSLG